MKNMYYVETKANWWVFQVKAQLSEGKAKNVKVHL